MIINDDCFNYITSIPSNSVDLILTDPPYQISRTSGFVNNSVDKSQILISKYGKMSIDFGDWDKCSIDWNFLFKEYYRVLKRGGSLIIFYDIWKSNVIKEAADLNKFKQSRVCSWVKSNPVPINSKLNYLSNASEYFFTFVKGSNPTFNSEYDNGVYKYPICHGHERIKLDGVLFHPTQKPLKLIMDLVDKHSNIGDVVLDTFAGTFTIGEACDNLDRNWIGIEQDEKYVLMAKDRINFNRQKLGISLL